jgi:hypothetical protein
MTIEEQKKIIEFAILKNGVPNQLNQAIEEAAELIQAINKARRHQLITESEIIKPFHLVSTEDCLVFGNLVSEISDMDIILDQLKSLVGHDRVGFEKDRKLTRLATRLGYNQTYGG